MRAWLVLPFRSIADGKRRLEPHVDQRAREALNRHLLERALALASGFPGLDRTLLVSHCPEALDRARSLGAAWLEDDGSGHSAAVELAHRALADRDYDRLITLSCDVPLANESDVRALVGTDEVVLATDRTGTGTNALSIPARAQFRFHFGADSRSKHEREAANLRLPVRILHSERLAFDIDYESDYREWRDRSA